MQLTPYPLLTLRRISALTRKPVSQIQRLLDEHPEIAPAAVADSSPVYDRESFLRLLVIIDQADASSEAGR